MKKVRAKFTCNDVCDNGHGHKIVTFNAVYSETGENADFAHATPCGNVLMNIDASVPASEFFEQGKAYYLDFTEAPE